MIGVDGIMPDRNASATYFGFDFQARAAIVIMLENIQSAISIKLEGEEDIDIKLDNGQSILAQAKSVVKVDDFSHVREKLKGALESLSEGASRIPAEQLILITNSPNPFNDDNSRPLFWGPNKIRFDDLPLSSQNLVNGYLSKITNPLEASKFIVQRVPFQTDDEVERSKAIKNAINDFLGSISIVTPGVANRLYDIWTSQLLFSGTVTDKKRHITKRSFIWPIIVIETDIQSINDDLADWFDEAEYSDLTRLYHSVIDSHCERYEFITRVLYDYKQFSSNSLRKKASEFAEAYCEAYSKEFDVEGIDSQTQQNLTKIILYSIVKRWSTIERVRQGANL